MTSDTIHTKRVPFKAYYLLWYLRTRQSKRTTSMLCLSTSQKIIWLSLDELNVNYNVMNKHLFHYGIQSMNMLIYYRISTFFMSFHHLTILGKKTTGEFFAGLERWDRRTYKWRIKPGYQRSTGAFCKRWFDNRWELYGKPHWPWTLYDSGQRDTNAVHQNYWFTTLFLTLKASIHVESCL